MADIAVELMLLPTEHGGRRAPIGQRYRPQFYYDNADWDALYEYEVAGIVPQGRWVTARLTFCNPQEHWGKLFVGMPFLMREGNRVVGYGRVTAILDLEASARKARDGAEPAAPAKRPGDDTSFTVQPPSSMSQPLRASLGGSRARDIAFHRQRDVWTELLRQHAEKLRIWCAGILQRIAVLIGWSWFVMHIGRYARAAARAFHHQWEVWKKFLQLVENDDLGLRSSTHHRRDVWTKSLRRQAEKVRVWSAGMARRLRGCLWSALAVFALPLICFTIDELCRAVVMTPTLNKEGYLVVYDILRDGIGVAPVIGLLGMLVGCGFGVGALVSHVKQRKPGCDIFFIIVWLIFWVTGTLLGEGNVLNQHLRCVSWARSGDFQVVEGPVTQFHPLERAKKGSESFTVKGVTFSYSDNNLGQGGFRYSFGSGGRLQEGVHVRVSHREGRILKLEILCE